ncbi:unnamed protein product [Mytilus edulis]|uniref:Uncharacterized protein n=1 Tax=Mytilus edulis TaxID=6550 RepID=A0A8S3RI78_MYTED|nr:unnamed protein product [Mytilus edulis]
MVFIIFTVVGVEGVDIVYGGKCTANGDCTDANNVCTATKCACSPTSYKTDGSNKCAKKIDLGGTCTATPTGQCADANAECDGTDSICVCTANYFANKKSVCAPRKKPEETCAAHQCVTHATCKTTTNPTKCKCNAGYTATPTTKPTMCSGAIKVATLSYMLAVTIFVSMMLLLQ